MKIIKSRQLGLLHKTYSYRGEHHLVTAPVVFFPLGQDRPLPLEENLQWPELQAQLGEQILDMVMPKLCAEYLLIGQAYAPQQAEFTELTVSCKVAESQKTLTVFGQRQWQKGLLGFSKSATQPVTSVPLTAASSFGGNGFEDNPSGIGYYPRKTRNADSLPLAPVEYPNQPVTRIGNKAVDAGFGPLPITHSSRKDYNGDYSEKWLQNHYPELAPDTQFQLFNAAAKDQQLNRYLTGDESYELHNLHPEQAILAGQLPAIRPRCFVQTTDLQEVSLNLDTLWLLPEISLGVLVYHGQITVQDCDALDVENLLLAYENQRDLPQSISHYQGILAARLDPQTALENASDESQLAPALTPEQLAQEQQELEQEQAQQLELAKLQQAQAIEDMKAANNGKLPPGFEPPKVEAPEVAIATAAIKRGNFNAKPLFAMAAKAKQEAEQQQAKADEEMAQAMAKTASMPGGFANADKDIAKGANTKDAVEKLKALNDNPQVDIPPEQLQALEEQQFKAEQYSMAPISDAPTPEVAADFRAQFIAAWQRGENLSQRNWAGCDLSRLDLSGLDLSGCNLEHVNFSHSLLQGTNFSQSALTAANLSHANLENALLVEANLSATDCEYAQFNGANLSQAMLMEANWRNINCENSIWANTTWLNSTLRACRFDHSQFNQASIIKCQVVDCDFNGLQAEMLSSMSSGFDFCRWQQSQLNRCAFLDCQATLIQFNQSELTRCQFAGTTTLVSAGYRDTQLTLCGLRSVQAQHCQASNALFNQCDLGMADFSQSDFSHSRWQQSVMSDGQFNASNFQQARLFQGLLRKTQLRDCQLDNADFYEADAVLAQTQGSNYDAATNIAPIALRRWRDAESKAA